MGWSDKYKKSIDCDNPKGFSQKAHCQGRKKKLKEQFKPFKTVEEIAKKHRMDVSFIQKQLDMGEPIEHEHTKNHELAKEIALQHLDEIPDYYTRLKKMEASAKKEHKKFKDVKEHCGCEEDVVKELENHLKDLKDTSYDSIDKLMRRIMKKHDMTAKQLHNAFVDKNGKTPDDWIKDLKEGTLHHWYQGSSGKTKTGKRVKGWVQPDGSPCANEPGETKTPKCFSSARLRSLKKKGKKGIALIKSAVRRKRQKDKGQQAKSGAAAPTNVPTFAKGKKDPNYVKAEPGIKKSMEINEAQKDKPGKGSGKKDACYHKVKSRYDVWPSAYACVPENSTKALTKDSWKNVNDLNIGDEILTYNIQTDELEFKPILNLHRYKNIKTNVIKSGNNGFIFECTDNHKWVVKLPEIKGNRKEKYNRINDKCLIETNDLLKNKFNKHLLVSAPFNGGNKLKKDKIFKYGDNWIKYILDITSEQRQTWLFSAIVYDGNQKKIERLTENIKNVEKLDWSYTSSYDQKQSFGFKQKDISHRDAFLLSAFLNCGIVTWKKSKDRDIYSCNYTSNKRFKNTSNFKLIKENISDVWCPETENATWVMLQETDGNGIISITGNSGALVKCRKVGADNWGTKSEETQMLRYCPKCQKDETRDECKYGPKYWDMYSLPMSLGKKYTPNTPHPGNFPESYDHEYSMARSELSTIISAAKRLRKKMKGEGNIEAWVQSKITKAADYLDTAADYVDSGEMSEQVANTDTMSDKKPFDIAVKKIMDRKGKMTPSQRITALKQAGKLQGVDEKYNQINEKCWPGYKKKGMKTMFGKRYPNCVKAEEYSNWRADFGLSESSPAWQRKEGKNPTGGLNAKGRASAKAQGHNLKPPVTTPPSKLKPGSKAAKRRKSFCARMSGMEGPMKDEKGRPTRKALSLRKWNC